MANQAARVGRTGAPVMCWILRLVAAASNQQLRNGSREPEAERAFVLWMGAGCGWTDVCMS